MEYRDCEICGIKIKIKGRNRTQRFCSNECRRKWFAEVYVKSEKGKRDMRNGKVKSIKNGTYKTDPSSTHQVVSQLLNKMNIKHINEFGCAHYFIDIFLPSSNLTIEVMGTYWHLDPRVHQEINYVGRRRSIINDKAKNTYIRKYLGINTLYLWEKDILENLNLIEKIILEYINNNGLLIDYNSFNYFIDNGDLILNENLIIPYQEYSAEELNDITDYDVKTKESRKQDDRWIQYNCDFCGELAEELKSHFYDSEKHFCSFECYGKSKRKRVDVKCNYCDSDFEIKKSKYDSREDKKFYCTFDCYNKYIAENPKKKKVVSCNCDYCNDKFEKKESEYKKYKNHFCSKDCKNKFRTKQKIKYKCEQCGKECEQHEKLYNRATNHFCSLSCSTTYRNIHNNPNKFIKKNL